MSNNQQQQQIDAIHTVPSRIERPEALLNGLAVCADRGVLSACSIVPDLFDWLPGLTAPLNGLPLCVVGLYAKKKIKQLFHYNSHN
jgi:hypothetical protein